MNGSQKDKLRKRRRMQSLWREQKGLCKWCYVPMVHWNDLERDPRKLQCEEVKLRRATLDHLRDRFHPERHDPPQNQEQRRVLACWKCNNERGAESQAEQPIEVLHERAKRHKPNRFKQAMWGVKPISTGAEA